MHEDFRSAIQEYDAAKMRLTQLRRDQFPVGCVIVSTRNADLPFWGIVSTHDRWSLGVINVFAEDGILYCEDGHDCTRVDDPSEYPPWVSRSGLSHE